jgi:hypothetical protein
MIGTRCKPLHDVEVVIHIQDLRVAAGMVFMRAYESGDPAHLTHESESPNAAATVDDEISIYLHLRAMRRANESDELVLVAEPS